MIIYTQPMYAQTREHDPTAQFLYCIGIYVLLLVLATISGLDIVKTIANATALIIFSGILLSFLLLPDKGAPSSGIIWGLTLYYAGMAGAACFNLTPENFVDFLKILLFPIFSLFGATFENYRVPAIWSRISTRVTFGLLIVFPILAWAFQAVVRGVSLDVSAEIGIFVNRNNAALYALTLMSLYAVLSNRPISHPLPFIVVGVMFGTLGVLFAVMMGLVVSVGSWRTARTVLLGFGALAGVVVLLPDAPIVDRLQPVVDSLKLLVSGRVNLQVVSYGDLVRILNTTDLSFIFRLKHWWNLINLYADGQIYQWLFGLGIGSSVTMSDIGLVPHNDYLRILVECGLIAFSGFLFLLMHLIGAIGRRWELVPTIVVAFYFFSENLINNYLAMMIMFFCAGALATRTRNRLV